jgi:hypothetical protein
MNEKTPQQAALIATILENTALFPGKFQPPVHHAPGWIPMPQYLRTGFMKRSPPAVTVGARKSQGYQS